MLNGIWAKIHKWLALLMALQILFWFVSGLFFAVFPIQQVRSEHAIARQQAAAAPEGTLMYPVTFLVTSVRDGAVEWSRVLESLQ